jgi:hypothetical protein
VAGFDFLVCRSLGEGGQAQGEGCSQSLMLNLSKHEGGAVVAAMQKAFRRKNAGLR